MVYSQMSTEKTVAEKGEGGTFFVYSQMSTEKTGTNKGEGRTFFGLFADVDREDKGKIVLTLLLLFRCAKEETNLDSLKEKKEKKENKNKKR